jgi:hypothetical protein
VPISVHVHIVGLNRSLSATADSILTRVIGPLERFPGLEARTNLLLIDPCGPIFNPRTGEFGLVEESVPVALNRQQVHYINQDSLLAQAQEMKSRLLEQGDLYSDGGKSIDFALVYMLALAHSAETMGDDADVIVVLRPDVMISGRLWIVARSLLIAFRTRMGRPILLAPAWGSFGGVNDRFAMMSGPLATHHLKRVEKVPAWLAERRPFDSEKFLAFSLRGIPVVKSIYTQMFRIRLGARLEPSDRVFFRYPPIVMRFRDALMRLRPRWRSPRRRASPGG